MSQEIEQTNSGDTDASSQPQKAQPQSVEVYRPKGWVPVVFALTLLSVGAGGVWFIIWASKAFTEATAALTFIMGSAISLFLLLSTIATTCIYWGQRNIMLRQWQAMQNSVTRTDTIIDKMQGQLDGMKEQGLLMESALIESQKLALQTEKVAFFNQMQTEIMKVQGEALTAQVEMAGKQTELVRKQIDLMIQNERAYIGVRRMVLVGLENNFSRIAVQVTFRNGGKSPAFGFRAYAEVSVGSAPAPFIWKEIAPNIKRAFIPRGEDRSIVVPYGGSVDIDTVSGSDPASRIFIDGEARYRTLDGKEVVLCFGGTYLPEGGNAPEFEERHQYEQSAEANPN